MGATIIADLGFWRIADMKNNLWSCGQLQAGIGNICGTADNCNM
ncbi:16704_t:CDS:2 [Entrophospora sp. SA101]|nr:16704_t:CDS:2 [Entrophospora sp. SA101]